MRSVHDVFASIASVPVYAATKPKSAKCTLGLCPAPSVLSAVSARTASQPRTSSARGNSARACGRVPHAARLKYLAECARKWTGEEGGAARGEFVFRATAPTQFGEGGAGDGGVAPNEDDVGVITVNAGSAVDKDGDRRRVLCGVWLRGRR